MPVITIQSVLFLYYIGKLQEMLRTAEKASLKLAHGRILTLMSLLLLLVRSLHSWGISFQNPKKNWIKYMYMFHDWCKLRQCSVYTSGNKTVITADTRLEMSDMIYKCVQGRQDKISCQTVISSNLCATFNLSNFCRKKRTLVKCSSALLNISLLRNRFTFFSEKMAYNLYFDHAHFFKHYRDLISYVMLLLLGASKNSPEMVEWCIFVYMRTLSLR